MRILVITNMYPPHHLGGYELACRDAVRRWRAHGHDVEVLTSDVMFTHASDTGDEAVHRDLRIYWRDGVIVSPPVRERIAMERHNARALEAAVRSSRPDVVSLWHMGAVSLGLITQVSKIPTVLVLYDDWLVYGPVVDAWTRMFARRRWARGPARSLFGVPTAVRFGEASAACFMSEWLRQRAEERSPLELPDRRSVVYGGIDLDTFSTDADDRSLPGRPWRWKLVCAGRIEHRKGVHVAVEALAQLPARATLDIVGPSDDEAYAAGLRRRAAELGVSERIRWVGPLPRSGLADALRAADVFVFPVVWDEPFGMAPLEAMACGAIVVGTGTGGSGEFLSDGVNCLRVGREDPSAIAAAVTRLAGDETLRASLVAEGHRTARRFSDARYYDELEAWHEAAAQRFARGTPPATT